MIKNREKIEMKQIYSLENYWNFIDQFKSDPVYSDPHLAYEKNLTEVFQKENRKVYIVKRDGQPIGLFVWLVLCEDQYIEMLMGLSKEKDAYEAMFCLIERCYKGYKIDFVINPANLLLKEILMRRKVQFETEQKKMVWKRDCSLLSDCDIRLYSEEYKDEYVALHEKNTYWTAERVLQAMERFRVFLAVHDEKVIGYMDVTHCFDENEPYDLFVREEYAADGYEKALIAEAVRQNQPKGMSVLLDMDDFRMIEIYKSAGFEEETGQNCLYGWVRA